MISVMMEIIIVVKVRIIMFIYCNPISHELNYFIPPMINKKFVCKKLAAKCHKM